MGHHHAYGFGIIDDGDFYATDIQSFSFVGHFFPRAFVSYADGLWDYSISMRPDTSKGKLEISRESQHFRPIEQA